MSESSRYIPLPSKRSFRLLRVIGRQEKSGSDHSGLQCALDIFDLDDPQLRYVALSYTWGPPFNDPATLDQYSRANDKIISISHDGQPPFDQRIGRNLFEALSQIFETKWQSLIWADAICINQADKDELGSQVQLMGDIYSRPEFVIAWLGPEPQSIDEILWWYGPFLEYLGGLDDGDYLSGPSPEEMMPRSRFIHDLELDKTVLVLQSSDIVVSSRKAIALFDWFHQTRYWSRTWMHQELTLPKDVCFLLGRYELPTVALPEMAVLNVIPRDAHSLLFSWLNVNYQRLRFIVSLDTNSYLPDKSTTLPPSLVTYTTPPIRGEAALIDRHNSRYQSYLKLRFGATDDKGEFLAMLEDLLARSIHLSASDPRDKIYGLLGTITGWIRPSVEVIRVNYTLTIQDLLKIVTVRMLTDLPYLTCFALRSPSCYRRLEDLPSWVIDTTVTSQALLPGGLSAYRWTPFMACPTRGQHNAAIEVDGDALYLHGHYCGEITSVTHGIHGDTRAPEFAYDHNRIMLRAAKRIRDCLQLAKDIGLNYEWNDGQPVLEAIMETMFLLKGSIQSIDTRVMVESFWTVTKRRMCQMVELARRGDMTAAATAREYLNEYKGLVITLAQSGVPVPEPELTWVNRLSTEEHDLDTIDTDELFQIETLLNLPFFQSTFMLHRILFRTEHDFLGLAADDTKPGDQLWILCRARVPQILRPLSDGTFEILGEAYVHGGVDGELIEKGIAGPLRRITLV